MATEAEEFARAAALQRSGDRAAAEALCVAILARAPTHAQALHLLGTIRFGAGAQNEGIDLLRRAIAARPSYASAAFNLGAMLAATGQLVEAAEYYRRASELEPDNPDALARFAAVSMELGRPAEAADAYHRLLERRPNDPAALTDLTALSLQLDRVDQAIEYGRRAVASAPQLAAAHLRLGQALRARGDVDEAVAAFERTLAIAPDADAWLELALIWGEEGDAARAAGALARAQTLRPDDLRLHSMLINAMELDPTSTMATRSAVRQAWAARFADPLTEAAPAPRNDRDPDRRLRVGYVGADTFRVHTGSTVLLPVVEGHDRRIVDVYCYSDTPSEWEDHVSERFRAVTTYRRTGGLSDEQLAELIRGDAIDVLIETYGHPPGSRLLTLARRPAPVQIGFQTMGSTGMKAIDGVIADDILAPPAAAAEFTERVMRVPFAYVYRPLVPVPPADPRGPFERTGTIAFGCFNRWSKLNDQVLKAWAEILRRVPSARLVLRMRPELVAHRARFERRCTGAGLPLDRLTVLGWSAAESDYLAAHAQIDVALDPFPYSGGTTTCDALLMGVPVVALAGDRVLGRYSQDFLRAVDAADLVAATIEEYVALAVELATDHARRSALRRELPARFQASRLSDGSGMARDLERVYRAAWRGWCARTA